MRKSKLEKAIKRELEEQKRSEKKLKILREQNKVDWPEKKSKAKSNNPFSATSSLDLNSRTSLTSSPSSSSLIRDPVIREQTENRQKRLSSKNQNIQKSAENGQKVKDSKEKRYQPRVRRHTHPNPKI